MGTLSRRDFLRIGALGAAALTVGACAQPSSPAPAPTAGQGAASQPKPTSKTKITFAWTFATPGQAFQEELAKQFMEKNQAIEVEVQIIPQTQAVPKLTTAFSGGAAPDCMALSSAWLAGFAAGGYLEGLDSRLASAGLDKDLAASGMALAKQYKNTAYLAPFLLDTYLLYYNKQLLQEAGLSGPATTTDEFAQHAKKMTDAAKNRYGFYVLGSTGWSMAQWTNWAIAHGGTGVNGTLFDANNKCILDGPKHVEGLQRWVDLYRKEKASPEASATGTWQDSANAFNAGQIGVITGWMNLIQMLAQGIGADKFVVAAPPAGPAGQFYHFGGNGFAINAASKNKDAAWEYLRYLLTPETNGKLNEAWGAVPTNTKAWSQEWLKNPHLQVPRANIEKTAQLINRPEALPEFPDWFLTLAPQQAQKALLGQQTAEEFARAMAGPLSAAQAKAG